MATHRSASLEDTKKLARIFVADLLARKKEKGACIIGLYGDLGSGKTTFVQAVASVLGITSHLQSPTFVIMKSYPLPPARYKMLIHIDAYRLNSAEEIERLGWKELVSDPDNLIFIEWPERIGDAMPDSHIPLRFTFIDDATREIALGSSPLAEDLPCFGV